MALSKAEQKFREKLPDAMKARDWPRVQRVFAQYGSYLELIAEEEEQEDKDGPTP